MRDYVDTTDVQPGEPLGFIGVTYKNVVGGYIQEYKWLTDSFITKVYHSMLGFSKLEA